MYFAQMLHSKEGVLQAGASSASCGGRLEDLQNAGKLSRAYNL